MLRIPVAKDTADAAYSAKPLVPRRSLTVRRCICPLSVPSARSHARVLHVCSYGNLRSSDDDLVVTLVPLNTSFNRLVTTTDTVYVA